MVVATQELNGKKMKTGEKHKHHQAQHKHTHSRTRITVKYNNITTFRALYACATHLEPHTYGFTLNIITEFFIFAGRYCQKTFDYSQFNCAIFVRVCAFLPQYFTEDQPFSVIFALPYRVNVNSIAFA